MIADDVRLETRRATGIATWTGVLAGGGIVAWGLATDPTRGWANVLLHGFFFVSLGLGALFFLAVQYVSSAGWSTALRRVPEALAATLPVGAAMILAVGLALGRLYPWLDPQIVAHEPSVAAKAAYLNEPFFLARMLAILAVWVVFGYVLRRASLRQDGLGDGIAARCSLTRCSSVFLVLFAFTFSLASFDWLMSLEPQWLSTIFAVYCFAGLFSSSLAAITLAVVLLREGGALSDVVREDHLHDLGRLLFAFSTFWAYIWVSQYLLIWYSDLPEEVPFFVTRTHGAWAGLFFLNPVLNWGLPFLILMSRRAKRSPRTLVAAAMLLLAGHWLDLYLQVMPAVGEGAGPGLVEVGALVAYGCLFAILVRRALRRASLVPAADPLIGESLSYHT